MKPASWREGIPLARAVYQRPEGGVGCCLHIALDDANVEQCHIAFLEGWVAERGHPECIAMLDWWKRASLTQRIKLCGHYGEYGY